MTTDVVPELARNVKKVSQYWDVLADPNAIDGYSVLIPEDVLPDLRHEIEESLKPAPRQEIAKAVAAVVVAFKIPTNAIEDKEAFFRSMRVALGLAGYPADIINEAVIRLQLTHEFTPPTAALAKIAEHLLEERRRRLRAVQQMELEHRRRRAVAAEDKAEAERRAKREMEREARRQAELKRLRGLELKARERFGNVAPLPGDVELADSLSATLVHRAGRPVLWQAALAEGEHWAAQYCRQIALAERVRRALEQGRVSWDDALSATKLIVTDEERARRQIIDMQGRLPNCYSSGQPAESFWRAVWRIAGACGLDAPVFPEEAAATAINNLKHLTGLAALADTQEILRPQALEEWGSRRAPRVPPATEGMA